MKIMFLNVWHGKLVDELSAYIKHQYTDTDIFCFQESDGKMDRITKGVLKEYRLISSNKFVDEMQNFSQAIYLKTDISVLSSEVLFPADKKLGLAQYLNFRHKGLDIFLCNIHGTPEPRDKADSNDRVFQSRSVIELLKNKQGIKIIGGDFNLLPDNKSLRMYEEVGYRNLVKDYKIKTTRNHLAWDRFPTKHYYSDYVFINKELEVKDFFVSEAEVSDHLPLILEI